MIVSGTLGGSIQFGLEPGPASKWRIMSLHTVCPANASTTRETEQGVLLRPTPSPTHDSDPASESSRHATDSYKLHVGAGWTDATALDL